MAASGMRSTQDLTFVSMTGPTLDNASAKAMRAHTTRVIFRKRRHRLVQEYLDQKSRPSRSELDTEKTLLKQSDASHTIPSKETLKDDSELIKYLTHEMEKLYTGTGEAVTDHNFSLMHSSWVTLLSDPTMLDVSLYFATHVYAARLRHHAERFLITAAKDSALQSLRKRLSDTSDGCPDSLVAAILTLTILDQCLGDISGWKIHLSGLVQIVTIRSWNAMDPGKQFGTSDMISRTVMQGLLLFDRHDNTTLLTVERTGVFDFMFSGPGKEAAYLILLVAKQLYALQSTHPRNMKIPATSLLQLESLMGSLNAAVDLSRKGYAREAYLTAIALSMEIFLTSLLRPGQRTNDDTATTVSRLLDAVQAYEPACPFSSLVLCSSLCLRFWQTMMGAIAASDAQIKRTFIQRLGPICHALALKSWTDASDVLQRFFWVPSIFDDEGRKVYLEVQQLPKSIDT